MQTIQHIHQEPTMQIEFNKTKVRTLEYSFQLLKNDLIAGKAKQIYQQKEADCKRINLQFASTPQGV